MAVIKGQNLRMFLMYGEGGDNRPVAAATSCTVHVSAQTEDSSTKDSTDDWIEQEVVGLSWDCSVDALVLSDTERETEFNLEDAQELIGQVVYVTFSQTNGEKNREDMRQLFSGEATVTDIQVTAANRQNSMFTCQLTGKGDLYNLQVP